MRTRASVPLWLACLLLHAFSWLAVMTASYVERGDHSRDLPFLKNGAVGLTFYSDAPGWANRVTSQHPGVC